MEEKEKKSTGRTHKSKATIKTMKTEAAKSEKIPYISTMKKLSIREVPLNDDDQNS